MNLVGNSGHTTFIKEKLALCLLKNMELMQRADEPVKSSWIDYKQIEILDSKLNEFMQDFNFAEEASCISRDGNKQVQLYNSV